MLMLKEILSHTAKLSAMAVLLGLVGCGGGGGGDNTLGTGVNDDVLCGGDPCPSGGDDDVDDSSGDGARNLGNGSGVGFTAGALASDLAGASLPPGGSTVISATLTDQTGALITETASFSFTSSCITNGLATLNQSVVVTNTGSASVTYTAQGCEGGDVVTATVDDLSASVTVTVEPETISLGNGSGSAFQSGVLGLGIGSGATLSAGGQTTVNVTIANQNGELQTAAISNPIEVTFTSGCVSSGQANFSAATVDTVTGGASVIYTDQGCGVAPDGTTDTITASALGSSASATLDIAPDTVNQVQFVSVDPSELFLAGTGGQETAVVTFRVRGQLGGPVVGANVNFSLSTQVGGLNLATTTGVTNSSGEVSVTVQSGSVPTSVRVIATEVSSGISTISDGLTVATGIADSDNFSVVANILNPECWTGVQGGNVSVTAFVGDVFNNPVPDGSVVQFITEGGLIGSSCQTSGGTCAVTFTCTPEFVADGRITILGYTIGAESFDDNNTNGVFGAGDNFVAADNDIGEAFRDDNEDGVFNDIQYLDFNVNGSYDGKDGQYTGPACNAPDDGTVCSGNTTLHVFDSVVLSQSTPSSRLLSGAETVPALTPATSFAAFYPGRAFLTSGDSIDLASTDFGVYVGSVLISDSNLNSLPNGTSITVTADNGELVSGSSFTILNTTRPTVIDITMSADDTPSADGVLTVSVTVPGYGAQSYSFLVDDN